MLETSPVVSAEIQLKKMLDFAKFNWKSGFAAGTLLAVIAQTPFSTPLSMSKG
jgi:hypothetical protein